MGLRSIRTKIINALELDIVCVSETFLIGEQELDIAGFRWFGNNRKSLSKRACRGSGGVGILVRNNIMSNYDVAVLSNKFEGILFIQLIHKISRKALGYVHVTYHPLVHPGGITPMNFLIH